MFSYWIKNRFLFTLILTAVVSVLIGLFFVVPNVRNESDNALKTSVYEKSEIDFDIPAPTKNQLEEILGLDFVDSVFGYYYTDTSVNANGISVTQKIIFSDWMDSVEMTMFNNNRIVEQGDELYNNPIYVDYDFAKKTGVAIGDEIEISSIKFQVAAIYETNSYNNAILAPLTGDQKILIESKNSSYSGAFLKVNDYSKADSYLKSYKPEGRLKEKDLFSNEDEYNIHYNSWESANYYNEITSFRGKLEGVNLARITNTWLIVLIYAVIAILVNLILFIRKNEKKFFREKKSKKHIGLYYFFTMIDEIIVSIGTICLILYITVKSGDVLLTDSSNTGCIIILIGFTAVAILNYIVNIILLKNVANKNK